MTTKTKKICPMCGEEYDSQTDYCSEDGMKLRLKRMSEKDPLIGKTLDGRWIIEEKIGEGGMGTVYSGHQKSVDRKVAIKTLKPQLSDTEEFADRFFREAKMATKINHPHCVTVLDFGQADNGTLYLAMEFMEGVPLTDKILEGDLTIEEVFTIGIQISSALSAAHNSHIVHRDLKPDNIYVLDMPNGETFIKVLDFGIAKALDSNTQVTKAGMIFGTPEYMSPEQCKSQDIDGRSDLYGLGCILYELLGGRPPFAAKTPMAILLSHVNDEVAPIASIITNDRTPRELSNIVMKLLQKDRDKRFDDAKSLQEELEKELNIFLHPHLRKQAQRVKQERVDESVSKNISSLITMANEREDEDFDIKPRRSKLPYLFLFLLLAGVAFGIYAFNNDLLSRNQEKAIAEKNLEHENQNPSSNGKVHKENALDEVHKEENLNEAIVKQDTKNDPDKLKSKEKGSINVNTKGIEALDKSFDKISPKKKRATKRKFKKRKGKKASHKNGMPDPNGPIRDPQRKPRKAKPDPLPELSSPAVKALKALRNKANEKLNNKLKKAGKKVDKKLDDALDDFMK